MVQCEVSEYEKVVRSEVTQLALTDVERLATSRCWGREGDCGAGFDCCKANGQM